jgi:uncharacterized membrane protein
MFERKKYKSFAKTQLSGRWGIPILVTLFVTIITRIFSIPDILQLSNKGYFTVLLAGDFREAYSIYTSLNTSYITTLIQLIVAAILEIASITLYLKMSRSPEPVSFGDFIEGFNNWARATLGILWQLLWIFLWTFIFIIPGIIKAVAYSQMFYILAEFKDVSVTKAMRISIEITKGRKWDLFVMWLSFLGWDILSTLTCGILELWLAPYKNMTYTNAYHSLMKEALESGRIKPEDLTE